jgi:tRNA isopentenyl-2-thiomethyl-A-37 hydroxylase MiaE
MAEESLNQEMKPEAYFKTPEEELSFLREKVKEEEALAEKSGRTPETEVLTEKSLSAYKETKPEEVLAEDFQLKENEVDEIVLNLAPEEHDSKMSELLSLLQEKGVKNALSVVHKMKNPHIEDDFHRFLIQYIKSGYDASGLKEKSPLWKSLKMTLYEIALPKELQEKKSALKELISSMEQFYSGMLSLKGGTDNDYFTLEIAVADGADEIVMYSAVPDSRKNLFEKQLSSIFPNAQIREEANDYNIFVDGGVSIGSSATLSKNAVYPLKTYDKYDYDPLNVILNAFSKIEKSGGGAALQIVFKPKGDFYTKKFAGALEKIKKGESTEKALDISYGVADEIQGFIKNLVLGDSKKKKGDEEKTKPLDETAIKSIEEKISTPIVASNIRIVASAKNEDRAKSILEEIESSFNQFENSPLNKFVFNRFSKGRLSDLLHNFSYREFFERESIPLNIRELSSILHFSGEGIISSPQLKQSKAKNVPAPINLPQEGTLLGINNSRAGGVKVYLTKEDRLRHFYSIGQTGTGKTVLLKNMILQDIEAGEGVCMIDPHGSDIQDVLGSIPKERWEDVIYFDPGYTPRVMGLNMLEYDEAYPEQKTFVVNELFSIFQKLYGAVPESMGPMFEQYFRNAATLVLEDPASGSTLLDISRVLADSKFREMKLSKSLNPVVNQFWKEIATKAGGDASLQNIVPYITSKFDVFLANEIMRPIVAQQKSSFNFREIMDQKKILLVNLSKGKLGDINSNLIGLILVGKILISALSRADSSAESINPFYLYIDEFQNITTNSISTILSEARKYKLSLNVAHQFIAQLDEGIKKAVFGNVGSMASFRVGSEDATFLEKQFEPVFNANDLINIDNYNAYVRILANGSPVSPFNIKTLAPSKSNPEDVSKIKELSYQKYGRPREEVEREILSKYQSML